MATTLDAGAQSLEPPGRKSMPRSLVPFGVGAGLAVGLTAAVLLAQALQGRFPFGPGGRREAFQSILVHVLLVAYLPAAYLALIVRARQRLRELRRTSDTAPGPAIRLPPAGWSTWGWLGACLIGATLGVLGPYLTEPYQQSLFGFWTPSTWSPEVWWHRGLGVLAGIGLGGFSFALVRSSLDFSLAACTLPVDIFDLRSLRPFGRQGLTNGLLAAGMLSLISLFAVGSGINPMVILLESVSMVLVGIALVLPLRRVHARIRDAKARELARCDAALEGARRHAIESGADAGPGRLADLHAYRAIVREVPEWPVDTPVLTRFALYLLIPLGSWIASAVVQHIVERAIAP